MTEKLSVTDRGELLICCKAAIVVCRSSFQRAGRGVPKRRIRSDTIAKSGHDVFRCARETILERL